MKKTKFLSGIICLGLMGVMLLNLTGCKTEKNNVLHSTATPQITPSPIVSQSPLPTKDPLPTESQSPVATSTPSIERKEVLATNLMSDIKASAISEKLLSDAFIASQMKLSVDLFKSSVSESQNKNVLISPLSIQLALAMTANAADGQTKQEMESLLGNEISLDELNQYLYTYIKNLPTSEKYKLGIANSIWFRDSENLTVDANFLQANANYYGAEIYKEAFDDQTLTDINNWVYNNTDGMIDGIIDSIEPTNMMYLINALVLDAEWEHVYNKIAINEGKFKSISGQERTVEMMASDEYKYISDENARGFIKDYKDSKYSFAALLPNEDINIYDYINSFTSESLANTLQNIQSERTSVLLPKFSYEYELCMNDVLSSLGMPTAFDSTHADFSKGMQILSGNNIYIDKVQHKTIITVDELGTKAGAVTSVDMATESAPQNYITLDRPFVYMIMDNSTNLPIFIGAVTDIASAK